MTAKIISFADYAEANSDGLLSEHGCAEDAERQQFIALLQHVAPEERLFALRLLRGVAAKYRRQGLKLIAG